MIKPYLAALLSVCVVFINHAPARQQQPQPPGPAAARDETIRVNTAAVQIDVIVTKPGGRRITGLTAADFLVQDEGVPQALDLFRAVEGSRVSGRGAAGAQHSAAEAAGATT